MYRRTILRAPIQLDGITLSTVPFESAREQTKRSNARHHSFRWTSSRTIKLQAGLDASEGRNGGYLIVIGAAHSSFVSRQCEQQLQDIDKQQNQRRYCRPSSFCNEHECNDCGTPSGATF